MKRIFRWMVVLTGGALLALIGLGVAAYLASTFVPAIGTPSMAAVHESVADEAGGQVNECCMSDTCRAVGRGTSRCSISDPSMSGTVDYRVRRRGARCWDARLLSEPVWDGPEPPPVRMSDCVKLGDQF